MAIGSILLDTNAYAAFKRGVPGAVTILQRAPLIGISSIVLGELLGGFAAGTREATNRQELELFLTSDRVRSFAIDGVTAQYYATVYRRLKRKGNPIPTNDMWIAATALQYGLAVFSYDSHFRLVEGVTAGSQPQDFLL